MSELSFDWVIFHQRYLNMSYILVRMLNKEWYHLDIVPLTPQLIKLAAPASLYPCIWLGRPSKSNRESFLPPPSSKVYDDVDIHTHEDLEKYFSMNTKYTHLILWQRISHCRRGRFGKFPMFFFVKLLMVCKSVIVGGRYIVQKKENSRSCTGGVGVEGIQDMM